MTKQNWSPEPWVFSGGDLKDAEGNRFPYANMDYTMPVVDWEDADNAHRIVACVNACAGLDDPAAAIAAAREALRLCADVHGFPGAKLALATLTPKP